MQYPEKESSTVEFKESLPLNNQIVKKVIGFCNQLGGKIVLGVADNGTVKGLLDEELEHVLENLDKTIYESTSPPIIPRIYAQTFGDKTIVVVEVSSGMNKPYYLTGDGIKKGTYIRLGRSTMRATPDIIEELKWSSHGTSYDSQPVYHATIDDLDTRKIENFLKSRKTFGGAPLVFEDAIKAYNITVQVHAHTYPTIGGILLFGKHPERFMKDAFIICSRFAGIDGRETLATQDCIGTLMEQNVEAYNFVLSKLDRSFTIRGQKRTEQLKIPEIALREALVNALIHRNYHIRAPIKIAIYDNRIEIFSPGGFPGPLNESNYQMGLTFTRNEIIAKVFRKAGYSERLGTGLRTIFSSYAERGLEKPSIIEGSNFVKCILPRPSMAKRETISDNDDDFARILMLFETATAVTIGDIVKNLTISRTTAGRRLSKLVKDGILRKIGRKRGTHYVRSDRKL